MVTHGPPTVAQLKIPRGGRYARQVRSHPRSPDRGPIQPRGHPAAGTPPAVLTHRPLPVAHLKTILCRQSPDESSATLGPRTVAQLKRDGAAQPPPGRLVTHGPRTVAQLKP